MSDESKGGAPKKLSTKDILAAARATAGKASGDAPAASAEATPSAAPVSEPVASETPATKPAAKPPAASGAKPKSTADILAAARAQTAGGPAPAAPAGEKPAPKAKPSAPAAVEASADDGSPKLSVQEMLAAVRPAGAEPPAAVAPAKTVAPKVAPPMPAKPIPAAKKAAAADQSRRNILIALLLSPFAMAWALMGLTTSVFGLAVARFMMPNVLTEPPRKFKIGPPTDFDLGTVATKLVAQYGVWIVHSDQYKSKNVIYALAAVCTHLGCTPSWLEGEQKFKCPCHGSGFYITGINFEGPAPRPLERVGIRLAPDGMLEVDKSLKFQEEMGQWSDPASFFEVVG